MGAKLVFIKNSIVLLCSFFILLVTSCKKEVKEEPTQNMTFKMNGTEYRFDVTQFYGWSGGATTLNFRIGSATIWGTSQGNPTDFPYWFDIRKASTGTICAVLMPKEFPIPFIDSLGTCNFKIPKVAQNGDTLSAAKVFYYQSGNINYTKSNCGNKKYFDIYCLCTETAYMCDLSGTFDLTFRNGLNETITLTEGKFTVPNGGRQ